MEKSLFEFIDDYIDAKIEAHEHPESGPCYEALEDAMAILIDAIRPIEKLRRLLKS